MKNAERKNTLHCGCQYDSSSSRRSEASSSHSAGIRYPMRSTLCVPWTSSERDSVAWTQNSSAVCSLSAGTSVAMIPVRVAPSDAVIVAQMRAGAAPEICVRQALVMTRPLYASLATLTALPGVRDCAQYWLMQMVFVTFICGF